MDARSAVEILSTFMEYAGATLVVGQPVQVDGGTCTEASADTESFSFTACLRDDGSRMVQVVRDEWLGGEQTPPAEIQAAIDIAAPVVAGVASELAILDLRRSLNFAGGYAVSIDFAATPVAIGTLSGLLYVDPHPSAWG